MKLSVSLPDEDVQFLDTYVAAEGIGSRSAALHRAVRLLQASGLSHAYELAWREWEAGDDHALWDRTVADGRDA